MRMKLGRFGIMIIPEDEQDEAYIEEVLGLKEEGQSVKLRRENAAGLNKLAYLETKKEKDKPTETETLKEQVSNLMAKLVSLRETSGKENYRDVSDCIEILDTVLNEFAQELSR